MSKVFNIDDAGYELIKGFEGVRTKAYKDSVGIPTIGIGFIKYSTGKRKGSAVKMQDTITPEEIKQEFLVQVQEYVRGVNAAIRPEIKEGMTQNMFNALVSLCYNIGVRNFSRSTLVKKLNALDFDGAANEFLKWNRAGGKVVQGLTNRRIKEKNLFNKNRGF